MKDAIAMALRLIADGHSIKASVLESAERYEVKPDTLDRTVRRRRKPQP
jgi:hypothetical protein